MFMMSLCRDGCRVDHQIYGGGGGGSKACLRKQMKAIRRYADTNKLTDLNQQQQFIPVRLGLLFTALYSDDGGWPK